jgi:hypothetical protein
VSAPVRAKKYELPRPRSCGNRGAKALALAWVDLHHEGMDSFDAVWQRIEAHAGKEFLTKTGLPFTYEVVGTSVVPDRTGYPLHVSNFRAAFDLLPLSGPGQINTLVRGPAYVYAILTDRRIVQ